MLSDVSEFENYEYLFLFFIILRGQTYPNVMYTSKNVISKFLTFFINLLLQLFLFQPKLVATHHHYYTHPGTFFHHRLHFQNHPA